jgi:uncharacterized protein involved in high-affinity Fe2+ transport
MAITMKKHNPLALAAVLAAALAGPALAGQSSEPEVKVLATPVDASVAEHGVLVGRASAGGMLIQMELERANGMRMLIGEPAKWMEMGVAPGQLYHVEVKPIDPKSNTRIPYAEVMFMAINKDTGKTVKGMLHPMWGGSGLHYAFNSGLAGDGTYEAKVTVGIPTFARGMSDKRWMEPVTGNFHFKLTDGMLTEVSEPED